MPASKIVEIGSYTVTLDAEDVRRVKSRKWKPVPSFNLLNFVTNHGTEANPYFEFLTHFIAQAKPHEFVTIIDRSNGGLNLTKANLKVSR
jgi:hypothetical protein